MIFIRIVIHVTAHYHIAIVSVIIVENEMTVNVHYLMQLQEAKGNLNLYDTKTIRCVICQKAIGEVDFDAEIIRPKCGQCSNPIPDTRDKMPYLIYN